MLADQIESPRGRDRRDKEDESFVSLLRSARVYEERSYSYVAVNRFASESIGRLDPVHDFRNAIVFTRRYERFAVIARNNFELATPGSRR